MERKGIFRGVAPGVIAAGAIAVGLQGSSAAPGDVVTTTPIKHVVVIFGENISFDHYFGTYPFATNPSGEPKFLPADDTPAVNTLRAAGLLENNPNLRQPFRLDRSEAYTCSQDHN